MVADIVHWRNAGSKKALSFSFSQSKAHRELLGQLLCGNNAKLVNNLHRVYAVSFMYFILYILWLSKCAVRCSLDVLFYSKRLTSEPRPYPIYACA